MPGAADPDLVRLGLTRDEARAYLSLLARGRMTAREISLSTGITRGRIYDVLRGLLVKGAALEAMGRLRSFQAVPPSVAVANLLESRRREVAELEASAEEVAESLARTHSAAAGPPSLVEAIHHGATLSERYAELADASAEEILLFVRTPFVSRDELDDECDEYRALRRGVRVRGVCETSLLDDEAVSRTLEMLAAAGLETRFTPHLPTKLAVFDRAAAMLPVQQPIDPEDATVLVVRHEGLSTLAASAFEWFWDSAEPAKTAGASVRRRRTR